MISTEKLKKLKDLLDTGAITQEEFEQQKKELFSENNKSPRFSDKAKIIVGIIAVAMVCFAIIGSFVPEDNASHLKNQNNATVQSSLVSNIPVEFQDNCPISIEAKMYDNIIGVPELSCNITNNTDKEISAIKLYFSPKDVYGEAVNNILAPNQLYTDEPLLAKSSVTKTWQLLDTSIKSGDLYIYSVYFSDGSEWGNKDAATSDIKKYGYKLETKY